MGTLRGAVAWRIPPALPIRRVPRPLLSRNGYGTATLWWVVLSSSSCPGPLATCRRSSSTPSLRSSEVRPRVGAPSSRVFDLVCFFTRFPVVRSFPASPKRNAPEYGGRAEEDLQCSVVGASWMMTLREPGNQRSSAAEEHMRPFAIGTPGLTF